MSDFHISAERTETHWRVSRAVMIAAYNGIGQCIRDVHAVGPRHRHGDA